MSMGLRSLGANEGRRQLSLLRHLLCFPWSGHAIPMLLDTEGNTIRGASSLLSPAPFSVQTQPQAQVRCTNLCTPRLAWRCGLTRLPWDALEGACILPVPPHTAETAAFRLWISSTLHFHASLHQLRINCKQLLQGCWQGSWGETLMLHQALPFSPSGAGLEDMVAMQGDTPQLQRAALCSPCQKEPGKVTLTSTCSPSSAAC